MIARSIGDYAIACRFDSGIVRDSACINSDGGAAIGTTTSRPSGGADGTIRNSTLIATGPGSVGMNLSFSAFKRGLSVNIDAVGVIVKGEEKDVVAEARALNKGRGADVDVELRASDYATVATIAEHGGTASVTRPGTNGNVAALPLLAKGNLFQLSGSPTIDRGEVDQASGAFDVEGDARTIGAAPDIGADELGSVHSNMNPTPDTQLRLSNVLGGPRSSADPDPGHRTRLRLERARVPLRMQARSGALPGVHLPLREAGRGGEAPLLGQGRRSGGPGRPHPRRVRLAGALTARVPAVGQEPGRAA